MKPPVRKLPLITSKFLPPSNFSEYINSASANCNLPSSFYR